MRFQKEHCDLESVRRVFLMTGSAGSTPRLFSNFEAIHSPLSQIAFDHMYIKSGLKPSRSHR